MDVLDFEKFLVDSNGCAVHRYFCHFLTSNFEKEIACLAKYVRKDLYYRRTTMNILGPDSIGV